MTHENIMVWQGPSRIDGKPIVLIATTSTRNVKTGPMVQTWVLRADIDPITAVQSGGDYSVCGSCPLRGKACGNHIKGRKCYVKFWQAPNQVYKAYQRGAYPLVTRSEANRLVRGKALRIGSYGDPAAVPIRVWNRLVDNAESYTGYTHLWHDSKNWRYRELCMASVESWDNAVIAQDRGWRTFRILHDESEKHKCEILCPASRERGYATMCDKCLRCNGGIGHPVAIVVHGGRSVESSFHTSER